MTLRTKPLAALLAGALSLSGLAGCDLVDPTNVDNPALTDDAVLGTPGPLSGFLAGLERQTSIVMNEFVPIAEIGSDNYDNTQSFFNSSFDNLDLRFQDSDINDLLFELNRLRELSSYAYTTVLEADEDATDNQVAEAYYFHALANLYLGEVFVAAPDTADGTPVEPEVLIQAAIDDLDTALGLSSDAQKEVGYRLLQARAYHALGDQANATALAREVLTSDADYVRFAEYGVDLNSVIEDAVFDRATFDDLQPLPRLDFLDPKYNETTGEDDIAYLKAEEAYFILIEGELADGDVEGAKDFMQDLLGLVASRPTDSFSDQTEGRTQASPGSRPDSTNYVVRASAADPAREGLVLYRGGGSVTVPAVSGTSVTSDDVEALSSVEAAVETLYLLRQEVFFGEGRRFLDLGIKLPLSENESISNPNVDAGPLTTAVIPDPINAIRTQLDAFSIDGDVVTIAVNVNRVLAQNRSNPALVPFL